MADKAIFLDRDDTLIEDTGYINDPDQVKLLEGVPEVLLALKEMGYKLVVVSNQSAVARGIVTEEVLALIHKRLEQLLADEGASLDRIYYCPYHPEGAIPKYRRDSDMRKPNPGMLLEAGKDMDIDLAESWMVGNSYGDIEAGLRAGCKTILIDRRGQRRIQPGAPGPDYRAVNLKEVVNIIKMHERYAHKEQVESPPAVPPPAQPAPQPAPQIAEEPQSQPPQPLQPEQQEVPQQQPEPQSEQTVPQEAEEPLTTEQLLHGILDQLKLLRRTSMFGEFSTTRLIAGIIQGFVFFCLLVSVYFLMSPIEQYNLLLISLGFAILFQLMALTFYVMQGPK
jgi:D,D-heptose 1,7-bisphosphate phosphatase